MFSKANAALAFLLATVVTASLANQTKSETEASPAWKLDLKRLEYPECEEPIFQCMTKQVFFLDDNTIAVSFVTLTVDGLNQHQEIRKQKGLVHWEPLSANLHLLLLDAQSGKLLRQKLWPTSHWYGQIVLVEKGKLLLYTSGRLALYSYSMDFNEIRSTPVPPQDEEGRAPELLGSSDGSTVLLKRRVADYTYTFTLLSTETLQPLATWTEREDRYTPYPVSGETIVKREENSHRESRVLARTAGTGWRQLAPSVLGCDWPTLVNPRTVVLSSCDGLAVLSVDGHVLFSDKLQRKHFTWSDGAVTSAGGQRFALLSYKMKGVDIPRLDLNAYPSAQSLLVYDLSNGGPVYTLKSKSLSANRVWLHLSPDGSRVAVLAKGILELYELSDQAAPQQ